MNSLSTITLIINIYRESSFYFFVEYLRKQVVTERKLPKLVMTLLLKPACELVMLQSVEGFLHAFEHPEGDYISWNLNTKRTRATGNTAHVVEAVKQRSIGVPEIIRMLKEVFQDIPKENPGKPVCKYNNLTRRFTLVVQQAIRETKSLGIITKKDLERLQKIARKSGKCSSFRCLR